METATNIGQDLEEEGVSDKDLEPGRPLAVGLTEYLYHNMHFYEWK
jgi:hypothetical protein